MAERKKPASPAIDCASYADGRRRKECEAAEIATVLKCR
jgi:hypothetical protein